MEKWNVSLEYCGKAPIKPCSVAQNAGAAAAVESGFSSGFEYVPHVPCVMLSLGHEVLFKTTISPLVASGM